MGTRPLGIDYLIEWQNLGYEPRMVCYPRGWRVEFHFNDAYAPVWAGFADALAGTVSYHPSWYCAIWSAVEDEHQFQACQTSHDRSSQHGAHTVR